MGNYLVSIIQGIIEGVTEFLPISSTGHLIIVDKFIGFTGFASEFAKMFEIVIQLGAILSVVVYFRKRLFPLGAIADPGERKEYFDLILKSLTGVVPALVLGALFGQLIKQYLFNPVTVSIALVAGGVVLIWIEKRNRTAVIHSILEMPFRTAFLIGVIQCLAMVPGTSRSAATIIGAMLLGASRLVAAEFSFFLAIPTMCAASAYSLMKYRGALGSAELGALAVGFVTSFAVALLVIALFMRFITRHDFKPFGWYRIVLGVVVLIYFTLLLR